MTDFAAGFACGVLFLPALIAVDAALAWVFKRVLRGKLPWL